MCRQIGTGIIFFLVLQGRYLTLHESVPLRKYCKLHQKTEEIILQRLFYALALVLYITQTEKVNMGGHKH